MADRGLYWCQRSLLVTVHPPGEPPQTTRLDQPFALVGAHAKSDILLTQEKFRRVLYLHATDDGIFCLNLDESSGSHSTTRWLGPGRTAKVGKTIIEATFADGPPPSMIFGDLREASLSEVEALRFKICDPEQGQPAV